MVQTRSQKKLQEQNRLDSVAKTNKTAEDRQRRIAQCSRPGPSTQRGRSDRPKLRWCMQNGKKVYLYRSLQEEYDHRVVHAPKRKISEYGKDPAICYTSLYPARALEQRPIGRLPKHILDTLNDHYIQITHGLMVPAGDLYNNDDQPVEPLVPSIMELGQFQKLIKDAGATEERAKKERMRQLAKLRLPPNSTLPPKPKPYDAQTLVHGEVIGYYVIFGSGKVTRAVCSKTREVFTAHLLPRWKAESVIDVMRRLQIPKDMTTHSPDEVRLSEICVSKRTELIKTRERHIVFTPIEDVTIHTYCTDRLDKITEEEVMQIFKKVVEIVVFCHSRNVLIRNFRTRNFYLKKTPEGEFIVRPCFIQDMSLEEDENDTLVTRRCVSVPYMAPEMLSAAIKPLHCRSTEVWSLGILLYILLTGKYPFHDTNMRMLFRAIKNISHRWPVNFISKQTRVLVNKLLMKQVKDRMEVPQIWDYIQYSYPKVRCRSNPLMKQADLLIKCDMLKMYWDTYRHRLLPQNVMPIKEEWELCIRDVPLAAERAKRDMRDIKAALRPRMSSSGGNLRELCIDVRLGQINEVLEEQEDEQAREQGRRPDHIRITKSDVSLNLLVPGSLYPMNPNYHPSQHPVDWIVYKALEKANQLAFPKFLHGSRWIRYRAPKFTGRDVSVATTTTN